MTTVTVTLPADQWPAILYALQEMAIIKRSEGRDVAEAVLLEVRMEVARQYNAQVVA